jgi:hypothetical protein
VARHSLYIRFTVVMALDSAAYSNIDSSVFVHAATADGVNAAVIVVTYLYCSALQCVHA